MFNIGFGELAIICIVLIVAVGPDRLPSMMKSLGKTMRTLRNASRDLRESTGIDELLRDDYDYRPPPRRPYVAPKPPEPAPVSRTEPEAAPGQAESAPGDPPPAAAAPVGGATLVGVGVPPITAPPPAGPTSTPPPAAAAPSGSGTQPGMPAPEPPPAAAAAGAPDPTKLHGA